MCLHCRLNERSRIVLNSLLLCSTIATGDILSCVGMLFFIDPHFTTHAYPCLTLLVVSAQRNLMAFLDLDDVCGPLFNSVVMCSFVHGFLQSTRQPCVV